MKHADPWTFEQHEGESSKSFEKLNQINPIKDEATSEKIEMSSEATCSASPKLPKVEQVSPNILEEWPNQSSSTTMITPPPTNTNTAASTTSTSESINCSCCDYDGHFYHSHYYPPSTQSGTGSQQMTVNVPVVANFQVNVNTHHGYPLTNANNTNQDHQQSYHSHPISRKTNMYYPQISPSSYYRNPNYPTSMKYNQGQVPPIYHQQGITTYPTNSTYIENHHQQAPQQQQHFPIPFSHSQELPPYPYRQHHHPMSYNSLHGTHPSNGHVYHQL